MSESCYKKYTIKELNESKYYGTSMFWYDYKCSYCGVERSWFKPYKELGERNGKCENCGLPVVFSHIGGVESFEFDEKCIIDDGEDGGVE